MVETHPDVLCFATHPSIRMEYVDLAVKYHVKGLSMEKPMALSMRDAWEMQRRLDDASVRSVVSLQMKYFAAFQHLKATVDNRQFGELTGIFAETTPWMHIIGTHFMDYILWISGAKSANWVAGHVQGRNKLQDNHASPDFLMGLVQLDSGLRARIECGYLSEPHMSDREFWVDDRLTVYGTDGYAWVDTLGKLGLCSPQTGGRLQIEQYSAAGQHQESAEMQYYRDFFIWLNGGAEHPCSFNRALAGYEILSAMCLSGLDNRRVDIPLGHEADNVVARLCGELPEQHVPQALRKKRFFEHWGS